MKRPPASRRAPRFVVRGQHPVRQLLLGLVAGVALGAGGLLLAGLETGALTPPPATADGDEAARRLLQTRIAELSAENDRLSAELVTLRREQQVETLAEEGAAAHLRRLQDQVSSLRQEVAFYRGVVAGSSGRGFEVQNFVATAAEETGAWRFRVVLTNDSKDDKVRRGFVSFSVDGEQDGEPVRLSLQELTGRDEPGFEFRFRVYQKVEGKLLLPEGFTPRVVNVEVSGADGVVSGVKRSFDWPGNVG